MPTFLSRERGEDTDCPLLTLGMATDLRPCSSAKVRMLIVALSSVPMHSSCAAAVHFGECTWIK